MKFVFTFYILVLGLQAYSHTVITGTGQGSLIQQDMKGLHPGDTLAVRAGHYEKGGSFMNLTGITIINYQGIVDFGATVTLGNLQRVSLSGAGWKEALYGFRFRNFHADAFVLVAPCRSLTIAYCEYRDLEGTAFNASQFFTTYNGDSNTFALYKTVFRYQKLVHAKALFIGSWAACSTFQNVVDSIAFLNIIVDSTNSDVCQVLASSIYRMLASHWRITGPTPNGMHDAGIFQTSGNGTVCNIYRNGGWGYLWRSWNLGLNGRADSYLYNCIDLNSTNYGTIDTRMQSFDTTTGSTIPFVRGASMHVLNNTSGNKKTPNYVSQIVVVGDYCASSGYRLEIRNNLAFNTVAIGANLLVKQNSADPIPDTSNNLYSKDPIADGILLDTVECKLNPDGPAIDRAISYPFIPADIDGIPRPDGKSDIGAREFQADMFIQKPNQGGILQKWLLLATGGLAIVISLLAFSKMRRKKVKNSQTLFLGGFRGADKAFKTFQS